MRAAVLTAVRDIELQDVADPRIHHRTDAIVAVTATSICGSDLHPYRGHGATRFPKRTGHEFIGVVTAIGSEVASVAVGDVVVAPFAISDGTCVPCRNGVQTSCVQGSFWGAPDRSGVLADGGQAEEVRVPLADGTLVRVATPVKDELLPHLLALTDVMGTGQHAAVSAGVGPGATVVVVGDGAVGLCAVLAARRLGAARIIAMSRHPARQQIATEFGATDIVAERGPEGIGRILDLLNGSGADAALECAGSQESLTQALGVTRPGGRLGCVGAPFFQLPVAELFARNIGIRAGVAPVRAYLPSLLADVLDEKIHPGRVFDLHLPLAQVAEGYRAMDERRAIKVMLRP